MDEPRFFIRETLDQRDVESFYVNYPHLFSIKLHHGGNFTKFPGRVYNRAIIHYVDMLDVDKFSVHELDGILEQLEYSPKAIRYYHYIVPGGELDWGLRALGSDEDVRGFAQFVGAFKLIDVYVEHDVTNVHTFFCSPSKKVIEEISNEELLAREIVTDKANTTKRRLLLEWQDGRAISDVLTNNMCECFNSKLVDGRDKPIITLLEFIREYLMRKIVNVLKVIDRSSGLLTPYATKMMESIKKEANRYTVHWNGEEHYQVTGPSGDQCVVNMSANTCACRRWEVTGIPCRHVVASIWVKAAHDPTVGRPETFVNPIYTMDRWKEVYSYKVYPINGMSMWPTSQIPIQITAPKYKKQAGRPKKTRKKSAVEKEDGGSRKKAKGKEKVVEVEGQKAKAVRKSRPKGSNTCGTCGQKGHNKRSCMASTAD